VPDGGGAALGATCGSSGALPGACAIAVPGAGAEDVEATTGTLAGVGDGSELDAGGTRHARIARIAMSNAAATSPSLAARDAARGDFVVATTLFGGDVRNTSAVVSRRTPEAASRTDTGLTLARSRGEPTARASADAKTAALS
jgi:hypothetical protein